MLSRQSALQVGEHLVEAVTPVFAVHGAGELPALKYMRIFSSIAFDCSKCE